MKLKSMHVQTSCNVICAGSESLLEEMPFFQSPYMNYEASCEL